MIFTKTIKHFISTLLVPLFLFQFLVLLPLKAEAAPAAEAKPAVAVGAVAGAIALAVGIIAGLTGWIDAQSDDCAATAMGSVYGPQECGCGYESKEGKRVGYTSASIEKEVENDCAYAKGSAESSESIMGRWASAEAEAESEAKAKPYNCPQKPNDKNWGKGWAWASVDGTAKFDSSGTQDDSGSGKAWSISGRPGPETPEPLGWPYDLPDIYPPGTKVAYGRVHDIAIQAGKNTSSPSRMHFLATVDSQVIFEATATLDGDGGLTVTGDLPDSIFTEPVENADGTWQTTLNEYTFHMALPPAPGGKRADGGESESSIHVEAESESNEETAGGTVSEDPLILFDQSQRGHGDNAAPGGLILGKNTPNPFNPTTTIPFSLPSPSEVSLKVYDVSGRVVQTLVDQNLSAGEHEIEWFGRDGRGKEVPSGVYFYALETPGERQTCRMILIR